MAVIVNITSMPIDSFVEKNDDSDTKDEKIVAYEECCAAVQRAYDEGDITKETMIKNKKACEWYLE